MWSLFKAVILAENVVYALLWLAEKPAVNFLKPGENQKNYGLGVYSRGTPMHAWRNKIRGNIGLVMSDQEHH